jgi:excisionase family DNA binding protein
MTDEQGENIPFAETLKAGEAAERMQISHRKLQKLIQAGELRTLGDPRHPRIIRIPIVDIENWLKKAGPPLRHKK